MNVSDYLLFLPILLIFIFLLLVILLFRLLSSSSSYSLLSPPLLRFLSPPPPLLLLLLLLYANAQLPPKARPQHDALAWKPWIFVSKADTPVSVGREAGGRGRQLSHLAASYVNHHLLVRADSKESNMKANSHVAALMCFWKSVQVLFVRPYVYYSHGYACAI